MAAHLSGEPLPVAPQPAPRIAVDTFDGRVHIEWDPEAPVTPSGQLAFFVAFLKTSGLFDRLVASCPLRYSSPNAPKVRDVLGTLLLSVLSGHWRYAHIAALRADSVSPPLLGMDRILSEDAVRRALSAIGEEAGSLDGMLSKVADFFEAEVDDAVEALSSLMEPLIMVVLGTLIGGMVVAMYLPIFKMGQAV